MTPPALEVRNLHKRYGDLEVLKGVDLAARDGDVISILGSSGSGKSTLLRCATLLETMDGGDLAYLGRYACRDQGGKAVYASASELKKIRESGSSVPCLLLTARDAVEDRVTGLGLAEHDFRLMFNFAPGVLSGEGLERIYETPKGRRYRISAAADVPLGSRVLEGSEDPLGGWISYGYHVRVPAPQWTLAVQGKAPFHAATVIAPEDCRTALRVTGEQVELAFSGKYSGRLLLNGEEGIERIWNG